MIVSYIICCDSFHLYLIIFKLIMLLFYTKF